MKKLFIFLYLFSFIYKTNAQCFPERHSTNWFDGWISCNAQPSPNKKNGKGHWVLYDLARGYKIDKWKIWNTNDPAHLDWGTKRIKIEYSTDKIVWKSAGIFDLDKAPGNNRYEGMDWQNLDIPQARYILVTALENFKGSCFGFAEIKFSAEPVKWDDQVDSRIANVNIHVTSRPNPFMEDLEVEINAQSPGQFSYQIITLTGQTMSQGNLKMDKSTYHLIIDGSKWPSGSYILTVQKEGEQIKQSIVKI